MTFEDTFTDGDFERPVLDTNDEGIVSALRSEPDLIVEGLNGSLISRLLAIVLARGR